MTCRTCAARNGRGSPTTRRAAARSRPDSMTGPRTVLPSSADTRQVPPIRIRPVNDAPVRSGRAYVLYWMIAARRRARQLRPGARGRAGASSCGRPLVVFEPLRVGYRWASDRLHAFVLQGMADNAGPSRGRAVTLLPLRRAEARRGPRAARGARRERRRGGHRRLRPCSSCRAWSPRPPAGSTCDSRRSTATACCRCAPWTGSSRPRSRSARYLQKTLRRAPRRRAAAGSAGRRPPAVPRPTWRRCAARWRQRVAGAPRRRRRRSSRACRSTTASRRSWRGGGAERRGPGSRRSSTSDLATLRRRPQRPGRSARPAACRRTCTSATSRRTTSSTR